MDPSSETDFPGISKMQSELQVWVGGGGGGGRVKINECYYSNGDGCMAKPQSSHWRLVTDSTLET